MAELSNLRRKKMKDFSQVTPQNVSEVRVVLSDIDDTITTDGRLTASAYTAMERLHQAGYIFIPVTGRSAGWCDHIARMWPVYAVVGENGAFYFRYDHDAKVMHEKYAQDADELESNQQKIQRLSNEILAQVEGCALASDQRYRAVDLAIDFAEDVPPLSNDKIRQIVSLAEKNNAIANVSSIHVNCWYGEHTKLSTSLQLIQDCLEIDDIQKQVLFSGDSPNDATMFDYFDLSVGVANVMKSMDFLDKKPKFITKNRSGDGFVEIVETLLKHKS